MPPLLRPLRAIAPFVLALALLSLRSSPGVSAGPREDREAAAAAPAAAEKAPSPPMPSASSALGSGAPNNASFLFTITARKAELSADPKVGADGSEVGGQERPLGRKEKRKREREQSMGSNAQLNDLDLLTLTTSLSLNDNNSLSQQRNDSVILKLVDANPHGKRETSTLFSLFVFFSKETDRKARKKRKQKSSPLCFPL